MKKILFLIHDLGGGGAERVLVNLVNRLDPHKFDVSVTALFGGGCNEQFLAPHIRYRAVWKRTISGNSKLMKLLSPAALHKICVKNAYDIEVSYLEGPSARIIGGCNNPTTKLVCWIHVEQHTAKRAARSFRSVEESRKCYSCFDRIVCVSEAVKEDFVSIYPHIANALVCYNTIETEQIRSMKEESVEAGLFRPGEIKLAAVGKITRQKGFDRLARIVKRLRDEGIPVHLYAIGVGNERRHIEKYLKDNGIQDYYTFLGYQTNPYKYVSKCDLFVSASQAEGFSTATAEALIVGTPVCTVNTAGMREMLGDNEYGVISENNDEILFQEIKRLAENGKLLDHYKSKAQIRGESFNAETTVKKVETLFEGL